MKKIVLLIGIILAVTSLRVSAQVLDMLYENEHTPAKKIIPYTDLRQADVMWSKKVIRLLDLKEKMNHPLYYPNDQRLVDNNRKSLIEVVVEFIKEKGRQPYDNTEYYEIYKELDTAMAFKNLGEGTDTVVVKTLAGLDSSTIVTSKAEDKYWEVQQIMLKEEWFFDRQRSVLDVRIGAIGFIRKFLNTQTNTADRSVPFWILFKEFRDIFVVTEVFNPKNDSERRTLFDIFIKRKFSSIIIRESNVYNDRTIQSYAIGVDALLEGERVKNEIFEFEHDLWEF